MRFRIYISIALSSLLLSGCFSESNPLTEAAPKVLAQKIFEAGEDKNDCMDIWANPEAISSEGFIYKMCEDTASQIAIALTQAGYDKTTASNVKNLDSWEEIREEIKILRKVRREQDLEKQKNMFKNWGRKN